MAPEIHATLGASSMYRWRACPGSPRQIAGRKGESSIYAQTGTVAHWVGEQVLLGNGRLSDYHGKERDDIFIDEEMLDAVDVYVKHIEFLNTVHGHEDFKPKVEQHLSLEHLYPGMFGTADHMLYGIDATLFVTDYKHGMTPVEADCDQLKYYALGALKCAKDDGFFVDQVCMAIAQPRAFHADGKIRKHYMTVDKLNKWAEEVLIPAAKATEDPKALLYCGDHCGFCPALGNCPEVANQALDVAKQDFAVMDKGAVVDLPEPKTLTPSELARVMDFMKLMGTWVKEVEAHAHSLMTSGANVPGYKMVAKKSNRVWVDEKKVVETLKATGAEEASLYEKPKKPKFLTVAKMEKKYGKEVIKGLWEKPDNGLVVAPSSDKRAAVDPQAKVAREFLEADDLFN